MQDGLKGRMTTHTANAVEQFQQYVNSGNVEGARGILDDAENPVDINTPLMSQTDRGDPTRRTALQIAIYKNWPELFEFLLSRNADVNLNPDNVTNESALQLAVRKDRRELVHHLLEHNVDVNAPRGGADGQTALHLAFRSEDEAWVERFLRHGADIEAQDEKGKSVLSIARGLSQDRRIAHLIMAHHERLRVSRPRRLIVCCDGTWMKNDTKQPLSNVARIALCFADCDREHEKNFVQIVHYQPGVGTSSFGPYNLYEGAFAKAISQDVRDAYGFICDNYSFYDDEIILIGFSRGAFTARALAALIKDVGVLTGAGRFCIDHVYGLWEKRPLATSSLRDDPLPKYVDNLAKHHLTQRDVRIRACAVWDTVASLGANLPKWLPRIPSRRLKFVDSRLCTNIDYAFQALALDEKRFNFQPMLWKEKDTTQHLTQCWFRGSHGDVGGGNDSFCLANLPLAWMISKLQENRLASFDGYKISHLASHWRLLPWLLGETEGDGRYQLPVQNFDVFNSHTGGYKLAGTKLREPRVAADQVNDSGEYLHISVKRLSNSDPNIILHGNTLQRMAVQEWVDGMSSTGFYKDG
ncbi:unnamed protein product [Clonostachys rhizophaga]|uniref:T6SS Phospholipase effector Tle1-like catalytic domain-containing protein n=1 Tax=Clonostachys rhizophaga TaxID=160324 RepID=A0A9N9W260_9HYPO|nr:unnamed protein product [Clonostachys rhizophaga]